MTCYFSPWVCMCVRSCLAPMVKQQTILVHDACPISSPIHAQHGSQPLLTNPTCCRPRPQHACHAAVHVPALCRRHDAALLADGAEILVRCALGSLWFVRPGCRVAGCWGGGCRWSRWCHEARRQWHRHPRGRGRRRWGGWCHGVQEARTHWPVAHESQCSRRRRRGRDGRIPVDFARLPPDRTCTWPVDEAHPTQESTSLCVEAFPVLPSHIGREASQQITELVQRGIYQWELSLQAFESSLSARAPGRVGLPQLNQVPHQRLLQVPQAVLYFVQHIFPLVEGGHWVGRE